MRKMKKWSRMLLVTGLVLGSCSQNADLQIGGDDEQGLLSLVVNAEADFTHTRAVVESSYKNIDNYTVVVTDKDGRERMNCRVSEIDTKMPLILSVGSYAVKAYYGAEHPASRDEFYVLGEATGNIKADQKETVEVMCTPTCGRIAVNFNKNMSTYYSDYHVTFSGTEALGGESISWLKGDTAPWYVKLKEGGEEIAFTITTTPKEEYINNQQQGATKTGTFRLDRNKAYKMNISANYTPTIFGELEIEITIDDSTNDKPVEIEVPIEWI